MVQVPDSSALRSAAEDIREGTPDWVEPGSVHDWRNRVAEWLEFEADKQDGNVIWVCPDWPDLQTPVGFIGFSPCSNCRLVRRDAR